MQITSGQSMTAACFCGLAIMLFCVQSGQARSLHQASPPASPGTVVPIQQGQSPVNLTVFSIANNNNCVIQGYPGSRGDSVVPGPLTFSIPDSIVAFRNNFATSNAALVVYNSSMDVVVSNATASGLTFATYYKDSTPTSHGFIYGGLVPNYNPSTPSTNIAVCNYNVTYQSVSSSPPPSTG